MCVFVCQPDSQSHKLSNCHDLVLKLSTGRAYNWHQTKKTLKFFSPYEKKIFPIEVRSYHNYTYLLTYLLTDSATPRSKILLEKLTCFQPVKKFTAFYGTRKFITIFTSACPCPESDQLVHAPILHPEDPS